MPFLFFKYHRIFILQEVLEIKAGDSALLPEEESGVRGRLIQLSKVKWSAAGKQRLAHSQNPHPHPCHHPSLAPIPSARDTFSSGLQLICFSYFLGRVTGTVTFLGLVVLKITFPLDLGQAKLSIHEMVYITWPFPEHGFEKPPGHWLQSGP